MNELDTQTLAKLEGAMLAAYEAELRHTITDKDRLRQVYGDEFTDKNFMAKAQSLCEIAALTFQVPISMVNLIGQDEQTSIASVGIEQIPTAIEESYCQHVVGTKRTFQVTDSLTHSLVCHMDVSTREGGIRAYLGIPLVRQGQVVGSFCIADTRPRTWTPTDVTMLADLGNVLTRYSVSEPGL